MISEAEHKVLHYLLKGYSNKKIASRVGVVLKTVKWHLRSIYKKLGVRTDRECISKVLTEKLSEGEMKLFIELLLKHEQTIHPKS